MYSRTNPFHSRIKERTLLTGPTSTKKTYHLSIDTTDSKLEYKVGDSIGVLPMNGPEIVDQILYQIKSSGEEEIIDPRTQETIRFRNYLLYKANLSRANSSLFKLLCEKSAPSELTAPENKSQLIAYLDTHPLLDLLHLHPPRLPLAPAEFCKPLMPLMPRFYSIASSPKVFPNEIHLTVSYVHYHLNGQERHGIGSRFLCDLATPDITPIPIYLQASQDFTLPPDPSTPIILIGPGTGIAPYRAFLQERLATGSAGRNWIFFGERNRASDFYYSDFFLDLEKQNRIRLDLAFSRDQPQKIYVQHKMLENKKDIWNWISEGAFLYVCGDANEMAKDVDAALQQIIREEGNLNEEEARRYLKTLRTEKRYLLDVY